ncbi:MAG: OprO/OprP family phosphate-selective porin [Muribaculaceae bacterium]|nr:OprO/OprP family phosphate-selective porin [Muribaculaceae bacterium]
MKTLLPLALAALTAIPGHAATDIKADSTSFSYIPHLSLTLRPRAEWSTATGDIRFKIRNSDLAMSGNILPSVAYYLRADYCAAGKFQVHDAWVRVGFGRGFAVQGGQFRIPFGVESFRAPWNYYFINRSFMGKQMCNQRSVGVKGMWTATKLPLTAEFGVFNPTSYADHSIWVRTVAFGGKASYRVSNTTFTAGGLSIRPADVRINFADICAQWQYNRWTVVGEYMYEHYTNSAHRPAHSYVAFADYKMPLRTHLFNRMSFQGRFDGLTAHSNGTPDEHGHIITDNAARNRLTLGATLSYVHTSGRFLELRANYEQFFYHHDYHPSPSDDNMASVELVLHF